jgi:hypothetical protein
MWYQAVKMIIQQHFIAFMDDIQRFLPLTGAGQQLIIPRDLCPVR